MRLSKKLVEIGFCSRRKADQFIKEGRICVNNHIAILGEKVDGGEIIKIDGKIINIDDKKILLAYNKEKGVVCTESDEEKSPKIIDKIKQFGFDKRMFTIGRLDKLSTGLILITNDGDLAKEITDKKNMYEKEYEVIVDKDITDDFVKKMSCGIYLPEIDKTTKPCILRVDKLNRRKFFITIVEGLNRQIRRMCSALQYNVCQLKRIRIMHLRIGNLHFGEYVQIKKQNLFEDFTICVKNNIHKRNNKNTNLKKINKFDNRNKAIKIFTKI